MTCSYNVNDFISGLVGDATTVPSGRFHTIVMDSGAFTTELISIQYRSKWGMSVKYRVG